MKQFTLVVLDEQYIFYNMKVIFLFDRKI